MNHQPLRKVKLKIHGMHCQSCEVLVERKFKTVSGVEKVRVDHASGTAVLRCRCEPDLAQLDAAVKSDGYSVKPWATPEHSAASAGEPSTRQHYVQAGAAFLILLGLYLLLRQYDFLPKGLGLTDQMSYGAVFVVGLVAAASTCIAVTGGLLLAVAAKYNERYPDLNGVQKFRPHLYFNAGRLASYAVFGGAIGAVGSLFTFSPRATGLLTITASVAMIILGVQLLKIFPWVSRLQPRLPKFLAHKVHDLGRTPSRVAPAVLGAGTFFLPCGFTQALQLYVLSRGDWRAGALTMLVFALGTLPALLSLGVISSFARGSFQRYFLKFSGALIIVLGISNIGNGMTLAGVPLRLPGLGPAADVRAAAGAAAWADPNVTFDGGKQVVKMDVVAFAYQPDHFTIRQNIPVRWEINGVNTYGCQSVLALPALGILQYLKQGFNVVEFTPTEAGELAFHCSMGMYRGSFTVLPNSATVPPDPRRGGASPADAACDPTVADCLQTQRLKMEVTRERGFYPRQFTVKRGVPVELAVDTQIPLGGCMSVLVVPDYDVVQRLNLGTSVLRFTPTRVGTVPLTCSMGAPMAYLSVVE